jgi:hypothetical protein
MGHMEATNWSDRIEELFPRRREASADSTWLSVKQQLAIDQVVQGVVVARAHFGAWIDLGLGFPGLLLVPYIDYEQAAQCIAGEFCPVGMSLQAFVAGFADEP